MSETAPKLTLTSLDLVKKYVQLRDKLSEVNKRQKEEVAPYSLVMSRIENELLDRLNNGGAQSIKTEAGTFYKITKISATVTKFEDLLDYVRANDAWELLEPKVSKTAVLAITQETDIEVPGVKVSFEYDIGIRRS